MTRSNAFTRSARWLLDRAKIGPAFLCASLAWPALGCGAAPTGELQTQLDACDLGITVPAKVSDEQADCALRCLKFADCVELAAAKAGDPDGAEAELCLLECPVDLFSGFNPPEVTFGADTGQLSTSAEELLGKPVGNPDPETLVGVFEVTGFGSDERPEEFAVLSNDWRIRREQRQSGIAMAAECLIDVGGGVSDKQTLRAFVSSPIEVTETGIKILESHKDDKAYTNFGFDVHCSVELVAIDVPYCLTKTGVPEGYSTCVTVRDGHLMFVDFSGNSGDAGKKISN